LKLWRPCKPKRARPYLLFGKHGGCRRFQLLFSLGAFGIASASGTVNLARYRQSSNIACAEAPCADEME